MQKKEQLGLEHFWDNRVTGELERENVNPRKQVHTALLWREIGRTLQEKRLLEVLDGGAGFGRFSIPLAEAGHRVVHLDISSKMLDAARKKAKLKKLTKMEFVHGSIEDLSQFKDGSFDVVLCLDSPLSYCYDSYQKALGELLRVTRSRIILCVTSRLGVIAQGVDFDLKHFGKLKTVSEVFDTGTLKVTEELKKLQPTLMPSWHAFRPDEIEQLLEELGWSVERISAPGLLAQSADLELLKDLFKDKKAYEDYLDFEERYDSDVYGMGVAAQIGGGLLVTARKITEE